MTKLALIFIAFASIAGAGDSPVLGLTPEQQVQVGKVCKHYDNRARFKARGAEQEFVVTLADGCQSAKRSMSTGTTEQRLTAIRFLTQLVVLRDTVIDMNMERVFGKTYSRYTRIPYANSGRTEAVRQVSALGEFLIAHRMGLIDAYNAWVDADPQKTVAMRLGD